MAAKPSDARGTWTQRCWLHTRLRVGALVGCGFLSAVDACCEDHELAVSDLNGRMSFGAEVAAHVEFTVDMEITWVESLGFSGWAGLSGAADARIGFDPEGLDAFETTMDVDIDDDGVDESVSFVAFASGAPDDPERVFAAWRGDKYTFDAGICYLLWSEGDTIEMLSGPCENGGEGAPVLSCTLGSGRQGKFGCDACGDAGECVACENGESVASCMTDGARELDVAPSEVGGSGGEAGEGGTVPAGEGGAAGAHEEGGAAGAREEGGAAGAREEGGVAGAPGAGGSGAEDVALCLSLASALASAGQLCGLREAASHEVLCSDHLADVTACSAALDAVGLFEDPCRALRSAISCGSVFE